MYVHLFLCTVVNVSNVRTVRPISLKFSVEGIVYPPEVGTLIIIEISASKTVAHLAVG